MNYIEISSNRYPVSERDIRAMFPNTSFPAIFQPTADYAAVFPTPQPLFDPITEIAIEAPPVKTEKGHYEQRWTVATLEEAAADVNYTAKVARLFATIAERRYSVETAGVLVGTMSVDTTRDSQLLLTGAALAAFMDSTYTVRWKTSAGFIELNSAQIIEVASAVRSHVQACFDREAVLRDVVTNGTITPDMIEEGWPV